MGRRDVSNVALPPSIATESQLFLESCPVALLYKTPIIDEVFEAHRWSKLGQSISDLYPNGIPAIIVSAVLALDAGLQMAENERIKEIRNRSDSGSCNNVQGQ